MGTTESVENCNKSQFIGYSKINQYLRECLKLLKKKIDSGQSVISTENIKYERVCMLMKMIQSGRVKCAKSTYKEYITSTITPYHLIGKTQRIKEYFCYRNKTCKIFTLDGLRDRIFFLMNKFRILSGKSYFWYELSDFWDFMKTDEEPHPLHCVVIKILQGK